MRLCEALKEYETLSLYRGHMPGHKGNPEYSFPEILVKYDITETDDMDNLHDAKGVIMESQQYASSLYGSDECFFLINGSTAGILSAVSAATVQGDEILIARNCHKSVYNAVVLNRLKCRYVYPKIISGVNICTGIDVCDLEKELNYNKGIRAVVITSPTYEGLSSDIAAITETVHKHDAILIVDAAHGAHFGFHNGFPASAVMSRPDIVIHSVHKTLPAPTQTALLHVNGSRVDRGKLKRFLSTYQSSSPSYLLMAGIDNCMTVMDEHGDRLFSEYLTNIEWFENRTSKLKNMTHMCRMLYKTEYSITDPDPCKIVISTVNSGISGKELYDILREEHKIQPEMAAADYCLIIMTIMDRKEDFERLINALECIDEKLEKLIKQSAEKTETAVKDGRYCCSLKNSKLMEAYEVLDDIGRLKPCQLSEAVGKISGSYVLLYPPGIPVIVPGEVISEETAAEVLFMMNKGLNVQGIGSSGEVMIYE